MLVTFNNNPNHEYLFFSLKFLDLQAHKLVFHTIGDMTDAVNICEDIINNVGSFEEITGNYFTETVKPIVNSEIKRYILNTSRYNSIEKYIGREQTFSSSNATLWTAVVYGYKDKNDKYEMVCYFLFSPDEEIIFTPSYAYKIEPVIFQVKRYVTQVQGGGVITNITAYPAPTMLDIYGNVLTPTSNVQYGVYWGGSTYTGDELYPDAYYIQYWNYYSTVEYVDPPEPPAVLTLDVVQRSWLNIYAKPDVDGDYSLQSRIRPDGPIRITLTSTESGIYNIKNQFGDLLSKFRPLL